MSTRDNKVSKQSLGMIIALHFVGVISQIFKWLITKLHYPRNL